MRNAPTAKGKDARRFLEKVKKNSELMNQRRRTDGDSRGKKPISELDKFDLIFKTINIDDFEAIKSFTNINASKSKQS